jgi:hypothetical protein
MKKNSMIMVLKKDPRINWKKREREREIKCMHNHNKKKKNHKKINKKSSIGEPDPFPSSITIA